jgi:putative CocE/NonD family hydrolase
MDIVVQKNLRIPLPDGLTLAADLYRPAAALPCPTLLVRTPYDKDLLAILLLLMPDPLRLAQHGYAVLVQDCRGCYASDGELIPFAHEAADTLATITWAAAQLWSDGTLGMLGGSYLGAVQWFAAAAAPPSLHAIAPYITSEQCYAPWFYQGGAFQLGFGLFWALGYFALPIIQRRLATQRATFADLQAAMQALSAIDTLYWRQPLRDLPELAAAPFYTAWLDHPTPDQYWQALAPQPTPAERTIPALIIGGWYDIFLAGTLASYQQLRTTISDPALQPRLVIGPWSHGIWHGAFRERDFGLLASTDALDLTGLHLRWFDYWLKGEANGVLDDPPVLIFVMGANQWREAADWPLPETQYRPLYLHSAGHAQTLHGDGVLNWTPPTAEPPDQYVYDPHDPVPTCGGATLMPGAQSAANAGPRDQRAVEARQDVLVYTSAPLPNDVTVIGPIRLILYAASSAPDTDFTGKLVLVEPDGQALLLTDGILRARYRETFAAAQLLHPGQIYQFEIDLVATANQFFAGQRIRLEVSSSNFPRFDRNTNTGGLIAAESAQDCQPATNQIFHDAAHPSHLLLPVIG